MKLVCLDRDGTVNKDENYYLGSQKNWKSLVSFLPGVVEGIKNLNEVDDLQSHIVTAQSGVALIGDRFNDLTETRAIDVNEYIIDKLKEEGAIINGSQMCPFVDSDYVKKAQMKGRKVDSIYVRNGYLDIKPKTGMIYKIVNSVILGIELENQNIYVIGDRASDVQMGLNAKGKGILVPNYKTEELGDVDKVREMARENGSNIFIAKNFLEAVDYVIED